MGAGIILRILRLRRELLSRERWTREALLAHQREALAVLRREATARSPFYRELHRGLERAPLEELPVMTKAMVMEHFDEVVTDRTLHLRDLESYLAALHGDSLFAGRYWVSATSGSSGRKAIIPSDQREWSTIIASYARANAWAGIRTGAFRRVTMAVVSSTTPSHQSARVAATVRSPIVPTHRFDAGQPIDGLVESLNALQPAVLVAYASMIRVLADEQLRGHLRISPRAVNCSSEVLTQAPRVLATRAWSVPPFEVYAATETGGIAAECSAHRGMHLFEDLVIPEVVDTRDRPVPDGVTGDKLLVTVRFARTLPLIRYEMTDRVRISTRSCVCGRPFRLVEAVEGRTDDVLHLPGTRGDPVVVHPLVLERALEHVPAEGWQVRQTERGLLILVARPRSGFDGSRVRQAVLRALEQAGARVDSIDLSVVDEIPAGAAGKRPLVVTFRRAG
jgi:putative adenylate-forming enzyme